MKNEISLLLRFMRPHKNGFAAVIALSVAVAILEVLAVVAVVPFFSLLLGAAPAPVQLGAGGRFVSTLLATLPFKDPLAGACALVIFLTLLKGAFTVVNEYALARLTASSLTSFKSRVVDALENAPHQYFLTTKHGRLGYLYLTSTLSVAILLQKIPRVIAETLRTVALLALMVWFDARMTGGLVVFGILTLGILSVVSRRAYRYGQRKIEANAEQHVAVGELLSGIKHLMVFRAFGAWRARLAELDGEYAKGFVGAAALQGMIKPVTESAAFGLAFGAVLALKWWSPEGIGDRLPMLAAFAMATIRLLPSFNQLNSARLDILTNLPDLENVDELLTRAPHRPAPGRRRYSGLRAGIRLEGVRFAYPGRDEVLRGVDLDIPRGGSVALVGESGSGKTTILNLLLGIERPSAGLLLIDGVDLAALNSDDWLRRLAVVTQDGFVFHGTVEQNIVFGRKGYDRAAVRRAAQIAQALDFVEALPRGFDTPVGERGLKLSGGQQQRLAIARAVLGNPELMIFDEATSALDAVSESAVQEALRAAAEGRTVVQVSHRLSTVSGSDLIAVLHQGQVVEVGRSADLISRGGRYADLHRLQQESPTR